MCCSGHPSPPRAHPTRAFCCSVLQCVAMCSRVLQCVAVCRAVLQPAAARHFDSLSVLQYVAVYVSVLCGAAALQRALDSQSCSPTQHTYIYYNTLQHTDLPALRRPLSVLCVAAALRVECASESCSPTQHTGLALEGCILGLQHCESSGCWRAAAPAVGVGELQSCSPSQHTDWASESCSLSDVVCLQGGVES